MTVAALNAAIGKVNDVLCASSVLVWDSRTMLPAGGAATRAGQLATLALLARDMLLSAETRSALDGARREVERAAEDDPCGAPSPASSAPSRCTNACRPS